MEIEITGNEFEWDIRYAGEDGQIGTADDRVARHLCLPVCHSARITLKSRDYIYTWSVPELEIREIAIPDLTFTVELDRQQTGRYEIRGDQLCGFSHPQLIGELRVTDMETFEQWFAGLVFEN